MHKSITLLTTLRITLRFFEIPSGNILQPDNDPFWPIESLQPRKRGSLLKIRHNHHLGLGPLRNSRVLFNRKPQSFIQPCMIKAGF